MYRYAFKHDHVFLHKLIQKVLFNLVGIVEDATKEEMKIAGYGSIMHDGWSKFGTHYVGIYAQYNKEVTCNIGKMKSSRLMPTNVLLAMRPMFGVTEGGVKSDVDSSDDENTASQDQDKKEEYAATFTADVHVKFFREVMRFLKVNHDYWDTRSVQLAYDQSLKDSQSAKVQSMVNEDEEFSAAPDELNE